jgi:hypothetical protein
MENINFISGGKTGDLFHNLIVVKSICEKYKTKGNIFITNNKILGGDSFHFEINKTFNDLKPVIEYQNYINSFQIIDDINNPKESINLNKWRHSGLLFSTNWINLLSKVYEIDKITTNWVEYEKNNFYNDKILIHRSLQRNNPTFPWDSITSKNKCYFITTNIIEYESFKYKDRVELILFESFKDLVLSINSCKFFIGNMSTPLALAHSLGVPRLGELYQLDEIHYIGEENYLSNYFYISYNFFNSFLNNIEKYIKL